MKKEVFERFLKYIKIDTQSDDNSQTYPSTSKQFDLAKILQNELQEMGLKDVSLDEHCYLMATLPANTTKKIPVIGFIAHMDTSPDMPGVNVNPQILQNFDGKDIVLNQTKNIVLSTKEFPELLEYIGQTLITTDGNTLLGADDKAGIAEIMTAVKFLIDHPEIKHGTIKIGFTPDEEIGRGVDKFDVEKFNAEFAYTMDGGGIGELEYENFNAAHAKVIFNGRNIHPGYAKDKMINAMILAMEFNAMLPVNERPEFTQDYEGFYHLIKMEGSVENASIQYIIRDHDRKKFEAKKVFIKQTVDYMNAKYRENTVVLEIKDQYYNMREQVEKTFHIVETAKKAMEEIGIVPKVVPIRGGTDGARLSFMGLPCPNIFAGGHNFHGKMEYVPVESMEKAVQVILKIIALYSK
ncbi:MAG TPA: peptidase T [Bacteroidales bacterium]|nr:peptidase T [Bacteroidales bacterium]HPS16001.1 peptidase T [Bacteroidales bacterium]